MASCDDEIPARAMAAQAMKAIVPTDSRAVYEERYQKYLEWIDENGVKNRLFSEEMLLAYFHKLSLKYKPPTLWCYYSMLKCMINQYQQINIKGYANFRLCTPF